MWFYHSVMGSKEAEKVGNTVDPGHTALVRLLLVEPACCGSTLFAQFCLSKYLGLLW